MLSNWQGWLIAAFAAAIAIANAATLAGLKALPSPLYGGDLWYQHGAISHATQGGNPFASSNMLGQLAAYFPIYTLVVLPFSFAFGPFTGMAIFSVLAAAAAVVIAYALFKKFFDSTTAVIAAIAFATPAQLILKYTDFAKVFVLPVFILLLYAFFKKQSALTAAGLGIWFGVVALSHGTGLAIAGFLFLGVFCYAFYKRKSLDFKFWLPVLAIGIALALLWWAKPIFVHAAKPVLESQEWSLPDFGNAIYKFVFLFETLKGYFFDFGSIKAGLLSVLTALGLFCAIFCKGDERLGFIRWLAFLAVLLTFSYFLTEPVLGTAIAPPYIKGLLLDLIRIVIAGLGLQLLLGNFKWVAPLLLAAIFISDGIAFANWYANDQWLVVGRSQLPEYLLAARDWVLRNTNLNDVFLSTAELSFALNALTGRKVVISRRAHNDPYLDFDSRAADAAVLLYSNASPDLLKQLIDKYSIKWLWWESAWIESEFRFENGKLAGWFDPIIVRDSKKWREYFDQHGVPYLRINTFLDPAVKGEYVKRYDVLLVVPNYTSHDRPWTSRLELEEVWNWTVGGTKMASIYAVK